MRLDVALPPRPDLEARLARLRAANGPNAFLKASGHSGLAALSGLSESSLIRTEAWELQVAEARLRQCAQCPSTGGACDPRSDEYRTVTLTTAFGAVSEPTETDMPPGCAPSFTPEGLEFGTCPRWPGYRVLRQLRAAGVPPKFLFARFSSYKPKAPDQSRALGLCEDFVRDYARHRERGSGIFISGETGLGKSHLAAAVLGALAETKPEIRTAFVYVPQLLQRIREDFGTSDVRNTTIARLAETELLVLDDLGVEYCTDWSRPQIETILEHRSSHELPTVLTTNSSIEELERRYHPRSLRRCYQNSAVRVSLKGDYLEQP